MKKAIFLLVLTLFAVYMAFSESKKIVVSDTSEVIGTIGKLKEVAQSDNFWRQQLILVSNRIRWEEEFPSKMDELHKNIDKILDDSRGQIDGMYEKYPNLKPSNAQLKADKLREQADNIEQTEIDTIVDKAR